MKKIRFIAFLFFFLPYTTFAYSISVSPDYGNGGTPVTVTSPDLGFHGDSAGNDTLSFFNEDGTLLYVSGNATQGAVYWFANSNGHGSGDVTFSTQVYRVVAWNGTWSGGTLVDDSTCYYGTYSECLLETEFRANACFSFNGSTGCDIGGDGGGGGGGDGGGGDTGSSTATSTSSVPLSYTDGVLLGLGYGIFFVSLLVILFV